MRYNLRNNSGYFLLMLVLVSPIASFGADSTAAEKPIGAVLRTVREIDVTNDTIPETLQIETTKARHLRDSKVRFSIYSGDHILYERSWKVNDFFDPRDKLSDTVKWLRLQHIIRVFFSNQNFSVCDSGVYASLFNQVHEADIKLGTLEEQELLGTPHKVFSVFAGRDDLYGITWLDSRKKFVTLWHN